MVKHFFTVAYVCICSPVDNLILVAAKTDPHIFAVPVAKQGAPNIHPASPPKRVCCGKAYKGSQEVFKHLKSGPPTKTHSKLCQMQTRTLYPNEKFQWRRTAKNAKQTEPQLNKHTAKNAKQTDPQLNKPKVHEPFQL